MSTKRIQIGEDLLVELLRLLDDGEHISLLGPRNGGKTMVIAELQRRVDGRPPVDQPEVYLLRWNDHKTNTREECFEQLAKQFGVAATYSIDQAIGFSSSLMDLFEVLLRKNHRQVWIFVQDVLGFPSVIAQDLLSAFQACRELPAFQRRISVLVTGSEDFIHLTYGSNSPYRYAKKFVINGLDRQLAAAFYVRRRRRQRGENASDRGIEPVTEAELDQEISPDAFQYLYGQTGGDPHLIQEIVVNAARHPSSLNHLEPRAKWDLGHCQGCTEAFAIAQMPFDFIARTTLREIERVPDRFDRLLSILNGRVPGEKPADGAPDVLEVSGLVRQSAVGAVGIACPIWKEFLQRTLNPRHVADVYAFQGRWKQAWETYRRLHDDQRDRPVSGLSRFRFRLVLDRWEQALSDCVVDGPEAVCHHFFKGVRYMLGFDWAGMFDRKSMSPIHTLATSPLAKPDPKWLNPPTENVLKVRSAERQCLLDTLRLKLWSYSGLELQWPPEIQPAMFLARHSHSKAIDESDQEWLGRAIDRFWLAYESSCRIQYNDLIGSIRERHLKVIEQLNALLVDDGSDMGRIVQGAAEKLVTTGEYLRIQIALVDGKRERIQAVATHSADGIPKLNFSTNLGLLPPDLKADDADWDVQQWVVLKPEREPVVVPDVSSKEQKSPSTNRWECKAIGMIAITVVPIVVRDEVLGTIHFERKDKGVPSEAELALFKILAGQIGVIFRQAERLTMLQNALFVLDSTVALLNSRREVVFLNKSGNYDGERPAGWQASPFQYQGFPGLTHRSSLVLKDSPLELLADVEDSGKLKRHYFFPPDESETGPAYDWVLAAIDDFREYLPSPFNEALARIGYVEKVSDLTDLFNILRALKQWLAAVGVRTTAREILNYFREQKFPWCRIYLARMDENGREYLGSLEEYGLRKPENKSRFSSEKVVFRKTDKNNNQPWHVFDVGKECIYQVAADGSMPSNPIACEESILGLPTYWTTHNAQDKTWLEKSDYPWIEAPLRVGGRNIGKISAGMPPGELSPTWWELFRLASIGAATALDSALRGENDANQKVQEAWKEASEMAVHQLSNKLSGSESFLVYARNALALHPERAQIDIDTSLAGLQKARAILADFRRYAHDRPFADTSSTEASALVQVIRNEIRQNHPKIAVDVAINDAARGRMLKMSKTALVEITEILVNNSLLHGGKKANDLRVTLHLELTRSDATVPEVDRIRLTYYDNGKGIRLPDRTLLFQPFKTTHPQGTGLGLSIIRRILRRFNGTIVLDTEATVGAAFAIELPIESGKI